jgi:carboxyl-terminal processing protease
MTMVKIKKIGRAWKAFTATTLALILSISSPVLALGSPLTEVRDLIGSGYVDPVGDSVINSPSIEEMLEKLGDPHTAYFTAQEYQDFLNSMDMTFSGIGVYIDIVPEGVRITSVMPGSPAGEIGIQAADILIEAGGQSLAGLSQETAAGLLRGPEGSTVEITLLRGEERLKLTVARRAIEVPTVTGEVVNGHTGYVAIASFGATTPAGFARSVEELRGKGVDSWIIDLRDNPGGYLSSALSLAGFFIGDQTAVQTKDRTLNMTAYPGVKQDFTLTEPVMFLTNEYSASASEILTAVVKDYQKATILGNRTYGKGSVQSMFPLSDGSVLKMTVAKFFSPLGNEINTVGISPDIQIVQADPQRLAELLLEGSKDGESVSAESSSLNDGKVELLAGGKPWKISLAKARSLEYWPAYNELLRATYAHGDLRLGSGSGWTAFTEEDWTKVWPMFYPSYRGLNELTEIPLNKKFTVRFTAPIAWESVTSESLELIESESGVRVPLEFEPINERDVLVIPQELLESGKTYWLLTHQGIQGVDGTALREGALAVAHTVNEEGTTKIQSRQGNVTLSPRISGELYGIPDFKPLLPKSDYGQAIIP